MMENMKWIYTALNKLIMNKLKLAERKRIRKLKRSYSFVKQMIDEGALTITRKQFAFLQTLKAERKNEQIQKQNQH